MDDTILSHLEAEAASLKAKLTAVLGVIAVYRGESKSLMAVATPVAAPGDFANQAEEPPQRRATSTAGLKEAVLRVAREVIETSPSGIAPTREIMAALESEGVHVAGDKPQNGVSSILSRAEDILSNGRAGWSLKRPYNRSTAHASNEIGAPNGQAVGAPSAEGVAAPSTEYRSGTEYRSHDL